MARQRHAAGTKEAPGALLAVGRLAGTAVDLGFWVGAGEGNRTLMTSLEGCDYHLAVQPKRRSAWTPMVCDSPSGHVVYRPIGHVAGTARCAVPLSECFGAEPG